MVGPIILCIKNTSNILRYMTSRERANIFLAKVNIGESGFASRTLSAMMSKIYDSRSTTFQKSFRCLNTRDQ